MVGNSARLRGLIDPLGHPLSGDAAASRLIEALDRLDSSGYDLAIVARGGGRTTDLALFDREDVCRAICRCRVPVIVSLGHFADKTNAGKCAAFAFPVPADAQRLLASAAEGLPQPASWKELTDENRVLKLDAVRREQELKLMVQEREMSSREFRRLWGDLSSAQSRLEGAHRRQRVAHQSNWAWWRTLLTLRQDQLRKAGRWRIAALSVSAACCLLMSVSIGLFLEPARLVVAALLSVVAIAAWLANRDWTDLPSLLQDLPDNGALQSILGARTAWTLTRSVRRLRSDHTRGTPGTGGDRERGD